MIEEILKSITEAEKTAAQTEKDAAARARAMILKAQSEADILHETYQEKTKADVKNIIVSAAAAAEEKASALIAGTGGTAAKSEYEKNKRAALDYIIKKFESSI